MKMLHLDSAQVAFLQRELENLDKQNYEDLLPGFLARTYIPDYPGIAPWQESVTYKMFTKRGKAKKVGRNSVLPRVGLTMTPFSRRIEQFGDAYSWAVREIQQAAATGTQLDNMSVVAARTAIGKQIDDLLALGNGGDIEGFVNNSNVNVETATNKTTGTAWLTPGNTPDQIIADFSLMIEKITTGLKQTDSPGFAKFVALVPTSEYAYIATTARSTQSDTTILQFLIKNNPWIESIEPWWQLNGAGATGKNRMVVYPRNPIAVAGIVPQDFQAYGPQERDLDIVVPCTGSCGGTVIRYPVAVRYMDIS